MSKELKGGRQVRTTIITEEEFVHVLQYWRLAQSNAVVDMMRHQKPAREVCNVTRFAAVRTESK